MPGSCRPYRRQVQAPKRQRIATAGVAVCVALVYLLTVLIRRLTGQNSHGFLNWNLFLAYLPLVFAWGSYWAQHYCRTAFTRTACAVVPAALWLLFLPNAPYVITDVIHIGRLNPDCPLWLDATTVVLAAATGLVAGFLSLLRIEAILVEAGLARAAVWVRRAAIVLTSVGIWLGRIARWNSWDIVRRPGHLLVLLAGRTLHPFAHPFMWAGIAAMTVFLAASYRLFRRLIGVLPTPLG